METLILAAEHGKKTVGRHSDGFRSKTLRQINCRTFHYGYGVGLLPRPKRTSLTKGPLPQAPCGRGSQSRCEFVEKRRSLSYSELWAGPTYSNSPPPTSLPIPKFSLRQKRTVSLSFPPPQAAKSAPVSPTSSADNPFHTTVSATVTLPSDGGGKGTTWKQSVFTAELVSCYWISYPILS
ncbi:unnamed protein product [Brassica napus]|uniref:(rape) hypothetical protein n=1 Tax=Brassica napus TaxID=3708 RepID=A0A816X1J1_BRANA|nr:unnamed protein product [Brassica napus]